MIPNPDASYRRQRGRLRRSAPKNANATVGGDRAPAIRQQSIVLSLDLGPGIGDVVENENSFRPQEAPHHRRLAPQIASFVIAVHNGKIKLSVRHRAKI
jgi:hypothetical protein